MRRMSLPGWSRWVSRRGVLVVMLATVAPGVSPGRGPAPAEAQPRPPVVLAAVDVHQVKGSRKSYAIVHPIAVYEAERYRDGVISADGITQVRPRFPASVLHQVKAFTIYHRGARLGVARVRGVAATAEHAFHCMPSVAGFGTVEWERPVSFAGAGVTTLYVNTRGDISLEVPGNERPGFLPVETRVRRFAAISSGSGNQEFFRPARALTGKQRRLLVQLATSQLAAEAWRTWDSVGRVTPRGDVRLVGAELIDADRDGTAEVVADFNAPLSKPRPLASSGEPAPALEMVMVATLPAAGKPSVLLSLATLTGLGPDVSQGFGLDTVLDIDGDGVGEVVLKHEYFYEDIRYEVYRLSGGRFVRVLAGAVQGC